MRLAACLPVLIALMPLPALSDVTGVLRDHVRPATAGFADATRALAETAERDCTATALRPAYQDSFDAWMGLSHLGLGPLEQDGRALTVEFWPDPRGLVSRTVRGLVADADPAVEYPQEFAQVSIAGRGLMALELLIYGDDADYGADDYACRYAAAIAADLAAIAQAVQDDWQDHAQLMLAAGEDGNDRYLSPREPQQAFYTALLSALEFDADQRLGRPMGSFDKPRPKLAEAWRSDRPQRNIVLSLQALRDLALDLAARPLPATEAAFATALATARSLDDPRLAGVATPQGRLKAEILAQQIRAVGDAVRAEIGGQLGLTAGFNSKDGD